MSIIFYLTKGDNELVGAGVTIGVPAGADVWVVGVDVAVGVVVCGTGAGVFGGGVGDPGLGLGSVLFCAGGFGSGVVVFTH